MWNNVFKQGRLKIWTEHSTLILLISKPFELGLPKVQHIYNLEKNEFSPNLEGVAQKMGPLCSLEGFDVFGRKSKFKALRAFIFSTKQVPIEVNNWWKFGVDISNHFWDIQFWTFLSFKVPSPWYKNNFQKLFYTTVRALWKIKMFKIEYLKNGLRYQHQIFTSC